MIEELLTLIEDVILKEYKFIRISYENIEESDIIRVITNFII